MTSHNEDPFIEEDEMIALCAAAVVLPIAFDNASPENFNPPRRLGSKTIRRRQPSMREIFGPYSPAFLKRTYRMTEQLFWNLLDIV